MGNGNRAAQKRDRKEQGKPKAAKSQLKSNEAACEYICNICRQTFLKTANRTLLGEHATSRHPGSAPDACFTNLPNETAKEKTKRLAKEEAEAKKKPAAAAAPVAKPKPAEAKPVEEVKEDTKEEVKEEKEEDVKEKREGEADKPAKGEAEKPADEHGQEDENGKKEE